MSRGPPVLLQWRSAARFLIYLYLPPIASLSRRSLTRCGAALKRPSHQLTQLLLYLGLLMTRRLHWLARRQPILLPKNQYRS